MIQRPELSRNLDSKSFREFYWLKEEMQQFCRNNGLPASGSKLELTERIAFFLDTGNVLKACCTEKKKSHDIIGKITEDSIIEPNFVCSEKHRAFFKEKIGNGFSFNVTFQKWLKSNSGKTYKDAIIAYSVILSEKKTTKTKIDKQFEYNTYIRDFFADNKGKTLEDAIKCWKYKKSIKGHNRYERFDLAAIK